MNIILLSGGSGKRLFPLSNVLRPKQFLKLLKDESGNDISMIQRVYNQITQAVPDANIIVATTSAQVNLIKGQLPGIKHIVVEPEIRDTFPAICLASAYLREHFKDAGQTAIVAPVDHYVDIEYFKKFYLLEQAIEQNVCDIALMGSVPTYPSEKYGYIVLEESDRPFKKALCFREKPDTDEAEALINKGALWNCGIFAFKLDYIKNFCNMGFSELLKNYATLPKTSFDYAVVEKAGSVSAIEYTGDWKDIGTWNTLTEVMDYNTAGNVILDETCSNTHVINEVGIPIIVMGANNMIIAASNDGIIVADKYHSSFMKKHVDKIT